MKSQIEALNALKATWPHLVDECREVLGSELHYQAMVYHCLRHHGQVPLGQLGMNVKMWIDNPISNKFKELDQKKEKRFQGGFEPIPDVVIFSPEIGRDWRRRNNRNTLRKMLLAIEVKASERKGGCLRPKELRDDILKLSAHREEVRNLGADMLPVMMVIDTAQHDKERTKARTITECTKLAEQESVGFLFLSIKETLEYWPKINHI